MFKRARRSDLDDVIVLIQRGAGVFEASETNETDLYVACETGQTELARRLLSRGVSLNQRLESLVVAVRNGNCHCVELLLKHHTDANGTDSNGESPISVAAQNRNYAIILLLLKYGATPAPSLTDVAYKLVKHARLEHAEVIATLLDSNIIDLASENMFLATFGFAFKRGVVELAQEMLSNDSYSKMEQLYPVAAYYSTKHNWSAVLSTLLEKGVDVNVQIRGQTALYVACNEGRESLVASLLNNNADPNVPRKISSRALELPIQIAMHSGNVAIFDMLVEKGAKLDSHYVGDPLLHIAGCSCDAWQIFGGIQMRSKEISLHMIRQLLEHGMAVNALSETGDTALYRACRGQQLEIVHVLLEAGADVNLTTKRLYPLIAACETSNSELLSLLLDVGADAKCTDWSNRTCLHVVVDKMDSRKDPNRVSTWNVFSAIKSLLEFGADINARCSHEETALFRASNAGRVDVVRVLLEAGAEVNGSNSRHPWYDDPNQILGLFRHVSAGSNLCAASPMTTSPVCCAMRKGYTDIVSLLLEYGADVNEDDSCGKTALIYAVEYLISQSHAMKPLPMRTGLAMLRSILLAGGNVNLTGRLDGLSALHIASSCGRCDVLAELVQHGADYNQPTANGETAIDLACEKGHEAAVELLLASGAKLDRMDAASSGTDSYQLGESAEQVTPALCTAAQLNNESIVKMLLHYGAAANTSCRDGSTALHLTTSRAIVEVLLKAGANVNALNECGDTALSKICSQPRVKIVETLLTYGADPNMNFPLYTACENNNADAVQLLLKYGADPNLLKETVIRVMPFGFASWIINGSPSLESTITAIEPSALCIACNKGNTYIVECLLKSGATVGFCDTVGDTPLHYAIERLENPAAVQTCDPVVTLLLRHHAPINVLSKKGETPLYAACGKGLVGVVKQLLDCNADVGFADSRWNKNPLLVACRENFRDVALLLLNGGAAANVNGLNEQTPLTCAAANGDTELVKELLNRGADVNQIHSVNGTALHLAVVPHKGFPNAKNFVEVVKQLLANGAEPNAVNGHYDTPLYLACRQAGDFNLEIVKVLLEHGADPNLPDDLLALSFDNISPLIAAAISKNPGLVALLIKSGAKLDYKDKQGRTALHYAADDMTFEKDAELSKSNYDSSTAELLLTAGADVNALDNSGTTPLSLACCGGKTDCVRFLLRHNADPNVGIDVYPIHVACRSRCYETLRLLLEHDGDVSVRDRRGWNALHYVLEAGNNEDADKENTNCLVQLLLDNNKIDVNVRSVDGETPLYFACSGGLLSVVDRLLNRGAKLDANIGEKLPLSVACRKLHLPVVRLLLRKGAKLNPNLQEVHECETLPLIIAACAGNCELAELLLIHGANVNAADADGNTALHLAISYDHVAPISSRYSCEVAATKSAKAVIHLLLDNKADVNISNGSFETSLYVATSRGMLDVVRKMLETCGGNPNATLPGDRNPLAAGSAKNTQLVDALHGIDLSRKTGSVTSHNDKFPLCFAVAENRTELVKLLLNAGAVVNAVTSSEENMLCLAVQNQKGKEYMSTIRVLLQHSADLNSLTSDDQSLFSLVVTRLSAHQSRRARSALVELVQLFLQHGVNLRDSSYNLGACGLTTHTLKPLTTFDDKDGFLVDLFRSGAGFQLMGLCCTAVAQNGKVKSIRLCQAVVLAGYRPSAEELQDLRQEVDSERDVGGLVQQLLDWLSDDRQQVPTLQRQCRMVIRRQLSVAADFRTVLPAIDELPLPVDLRLYLQFEGPMTDVDLETSPEQQRHRLISTVLDSEGSDDESSFIRTFNGVGALII